MAYQYSIKHSIIHLLMGMLLTPALGWALVANAQESTYEASFSSATKEGIPINVLVGQSRVINFDRPIGRFSIRSSAWSGNASIPGIEFRDRGPADYGCGSNFPRDAAFDARSREFSDGLFSCRWPEVARHRFSVVAHRACACDYIFCFHLAPVYGKGQRPA